MFEISCWKYNLYIWTLFCLQANRKFKRKCLQAFEILCWNMNSPSKLEGFRAINKRHEMGETMLCFLKFSKCVWAILLKILTLFVPQQTGRFHGNQQKTWVGRNYVMLSAILKMRLSYSAENNNMFCSPANWKAWWPSTKGTRWERRWENIEKAFLWEDN